MCIVAQHDLPQPGVKVYEKRNNDERKEKSRDAARERRAKEFEYFQELEELLPLADTFTESSQKSSVDKTSLIRLTVAYLKSRAVVENGFTQSPLKEEPNIMPDLDLLSCLDGFGIVLGSEGEVIFVSKNINKYVGLSPAEVMGQTLADYVHPCDLVDLATLTAPTDLDSSIKRKEVTVRMKCTVTERGRMVNLGQASYKPLVISGVVRQIPSSDEGGLCGPLFMGTASPVGPDLSKPPQQGVFCTRHSADMKFTEMDKWLTKVAGYPTTSLLGESFFNFVHTCDIHIVQTAFRNLKEQGLCSTAPYRFLVQGGGYCWIQTRASSTQARRGSSRGQTIICQHSQLTEVQDNNEILASVQLNETEQQAERQLPPPSNIDLLQVVQELLEEKPVVVVEPKQEQVVIIEPRNSPTNAPQPSSVPTSVIVSRNKPRPVTDQIFGKVKKEQRPPKATTSQIFGNAVVKKDIKRPHVIMPTATEPIVKNEELEEENEFFASLFNFQVDDLEQLAPHSGFNIEDLDQLAPSSGDVCCDLKDSDKNNDCAKEEEGVTNKLFGETRVPPATTIIDNDAEIQRGQDMTGKTDECCPGVGDSEVDDLFASLFNCSELDANEYQLPEGQVDEAFLESVLDDCKPPDTKKHEYAPSIRGQSSGAMLHPEADIMWSTPHMVQEGTCESTFDKVPQTEMRVVASEPSKPLVSGTKRIAGDIDAKAKKKVYVMQKKNDQFVVFIE